MEDTSGLHSSNIIAAYIQINRETPQYSYFNEGGKRVVLCLVVTIIGFLKQIVKQSGKIPAQNCNSYFKYSSSSSANMCYLVCKQYGKSLVFGSKYLYQSLPRLLTLWLDLGAFVAKNQNENTHEFGKIKEKLSQTTSFVKKLSQKVTTNQLLTAMPQLTSRICHPNAEVQETLENIIVSVLSVYPQQALWHLMAVAKSTVKSRVSRVSTIFSKVKFDPNSRRIDPNLGHKIQLAELLTDQLLLLCNFKAPKDVKSLSMSKEFRKLQKIVSYDNSMIVPLQSSLLPSTSTVLRSIRHFVPTIVGDCKFNVGFKDNVDILQSLQRPKKICIIGSDGGEYLFLGKPEDDLRKDSRLMEFNAIVNKLLKKDTESRKRSLRNALLIIDINTYAVVPLNEKCGLIQWVSNTQGLRQILMKSYRSRNIQSHFQEMRSLMNSSTMKPVDAFLKKVLPM
jgi:serine/threonine-protein kinase ATR